MGKDIRIAKSLVRLAKMLVGKYTDRLGLDGFNDFLKENGWGFYESVPVTGPGGKGWRYGITPYTRMRDMVASPISRKDMVDKLNDLTSEHSNVVFSLNGDQYSPGPSDPSDLSVILLED